MITNLGVRMKRLESEGRNWLNDDPIEEMGIGLRFWATLLLAWTGAPSSPTFQSYSKQKLFKTGW